jgi:hypothetical protein
MANGLFFSLHFLPALRKTVLSRFADKIASVATFGLHPRGLAGPGPIYFLQTGQDSASKITALRFMSREKTLPKARFTSKMYAGSADQVLSSLSDHSEGEF